MPGVKPPSEPPHRGDLRAQLGGDPGGRDLRRGRVSEQTPPLAAVARPPPARLRACSRRGVGVGWGWGWVQSVAPPFYRGPPLLWLSGAVQSVSSPPLRASAAVPSAAGAGLSHWARGSLQDAGAGLGQLRRLRMGEDPLALNVLAICRAVGSSLTLPLELHVV